MKYKKLALRGVDGEQQIYARVEDDGKIKVTCNGDNQDLKDWVAKGNTIEDAD